MASGPRLFQNVVIRRPTVGDFGDVTLGSGVVVRGAVWDRRMKQVIGGQGELIQITAIGFLAKTTDVQVRDILDIQGTSKRFEVMNVVSGYDDRGVMNHVGVELVESDT